MRKQALCFFCLLPVLLLLGGCNGKLAVVNQDRIFQESTSVKSGMAYLEQISEELQAQLMTAQQDSNQNRNRKAAEAELQRRMAEAQQRYNAEQQQVMNQLGNLYNQALEACRNKEKLSVIVSDKAASAYDPKADVTQKVIEEMDRSPVTFTPLSPQPETE